MSTDPASSYDELPYSDHCFPYTHPDYLATLGAIYGLAPPPVERCRVLELGCARGGNLVPMALHCPGARFVGIDLSARQIAMGQELVDALGLDNIDLRVVSITDVDDSFGQFDYIVCHGVFSWVPEPVRDKILQICSRRLTPGGIAYISYNTYPGWHARGMVRDMLAYHVKSAGPALDRVEQAREFLEEITRVLPEKSSAYARILSTERQFLRGVGNSYVYHEHLEETNHPFYFHEFMKQTEARGLRFLGEARTPGLIHTLPPESREVLEGWSHDEVAREQHLDFLCNRTFRRTLLCHADQPRRAEPTSEAIASMWVGTNLVPVSEAPDVESSRPEEFRKADAEAKLSTSSPLVKTALHLLHENRPAPLSFASLWEGVRVRLGSAAEADGGVDRLREAMLRCFLSNLVELDLQPPRFTREVGERPVASRLARIQAAEAGRVTNLRRRTVDLSEYERLVVRNLDGTHDRAAVVDALVDLVESDEFSIQEGNEVLTDPARVREMLGSALEPCLTRLANLALLSRPE